MSSCSSEYGRKLDLQFFVRMMSGDKTLVLQANMGDTVEHLHSKIHMITGIQLTEQRLIYRWKELQWWQTMEDCGVQNDAGLQLFGRIQSTDNTEAWRVVSDMVYLISQVCRESTEDSSLIGCKIVKDKADQFMALAVNDKSDCYKRFMDAHAPRALVMMYRSVEKKKQECADECIRRFVSLGGKSRAESGYCAMMLLEFCRLLKTVVPHDDILYLHCRNALGNMLVEVECRLIGDSYMADGEIEIPFVDVNDLFPILDQVGRNLLKDLVLHSTGSMTHCGPLLQDVSDFSSFLKPILSILKRELAAAPDSLKGKGNCKGAGKVCLLTDEVDRLFYIFIDLLSRIEQCMHKMADCLGINTKKDAQVYPTGWSHYLAILKELRNIAVLYPGLEVRFSAIMRKNKAVVSALIVLHVSRIDDHAWLLKHKDVLDFESRRHLALLMLPNKDGNYEQFHEMLIDRSQLLAESFEYIYNARPTSLQTGLFMEFKNEEAKGPGVLREWFCLVCQALFDPRNALFLACPLDQRRFYPNPASNIDPLHIRYFRFAGRVVALALMHKIQIGVFLDRVFFLQLAGRRVALEDIKDADPCIYKSCQQILEMDPEFVDSDALCLTFVTETEELGSREVTELCSGGEGIIVNSKNRKKYVDLIVQQRFVTSIAEQVSSFGQGFADILRDNYLDTTFFGNLELKDLDWMLHGSERHRISIRDWKKHTQYVGYTKSDPEIVWFWKVVKRLNREQKKTLLFFWTSVKYLPVEGFRGLATKLSIYKSSEPQDRLPSSKTCFYRLSIPVYPTKAIMKDRLRVITQDHVGCSFGTW